MTTDRFLPPEIGHRDERPPSHPSGYVGIPEAAAILGGISRWSCWRLVRRKLIPHLVIPNGGIRIAVADLEAFKEKCRQVPVATLPNRPSTPTREQLRRAADDFAARTRRQALRVLGRAR